MEEQEANLWEHWVENNPNLVEQGRLNLLTDKVLDTHARLLSATEGQKKPESFERAANAVINQLLLHNRHEISHDELLALCQALDPEERSSYAILGRSYVLCQELHIDVIHGQ